MGWPVVRLGDVVKQIQRPTLVEPDKEYRLLGMRSQIGGPFLREVKRGSEISASTLNQVNAWDFIYSRLFAWQGSFGVIPEELDGCYVSNEFPLFSVDEARLDPRFLVFWFGLPQTQRTVEADCFGSTPGTRNRYKEEYFLRLEAPFPSFAEQQRIVAKLDKVAALAEEASSLQINVKNDWKALLVNMAHRPDLSTAEKKERGWREVKLKEILTPAAEPYDVDLETSYPNLGIYSFARGTFVKPPIDGALTSAKTLYRVRKGQFIYSRLFAFEGAYTIVPAELDGRFVSNEFPSFYIAGEAATPEFFAAFFMNQHVWADLQAGSLGLGSRRQRVNQKHLLEYAIWLPPLSWQRRIGDIFGKFKINTADEGLDVAALMPAILDGVFGNQETFTLSTVRSY